MSCILFGDKGQMPNTKLDNSKNNFERAAVRPAPLAPPPFAPCPPAHRLGCIRQLVLRRRKQLSASQAPPPLTPGLHVLHVLLCARAAGRVCD